MDPSKETCLKCGKGGNLLICSKNGCPVSVHERCLRCSAKFDNSGRFCCPYCLYKQGVEESRKAKEYALAREKELSNFLDEKLNGSEKRIGENKTCEEIVVNRLKTSQVHVNIRSSDNIKSKPNKNGIIDEEEKTSDAEDPKDSSAGSKGQGPSIKMHGKKRNVTAGEEQVLEEEHETFAQDKEEEHETSADEKEKTSDAEEDPKDSSAGSKGQGPSLKMRAKKSNVTAEEEQVQEEEHETFVQDKKEEHETFVQDKKEEHETSAEEEEEDEVSSASTDQDSPVVVPVRNKKASKRSKPVDEDPNDNPMQSKLPKQHGKKKQSSATVIPTRSSPRKPPLAMRTGKLPTKGVVSPRRISETLGGTRRKKLFWTEQEVAAIRAGIQKHVKDSTQNIPWRKILEDSSAFHSTRTPVDLKDKWRSMSK